MRIPTLFIPKSLDISGKHNYFNCLSLKIKLNKCHRWFCGFYRATHSSIKRRVLFKPLTTYGSFTLKQCMSGNLPTVMKIAVPTTLDEYLRNPCLYKILSLAEDCISLICPSKYSNDYREPQNKKN